MKRWMILTLLVLVTAVQAQPATTKKELVAKLLLLQQPDIEQLGQSLAMRPAEQMLQQAGLALQSEVPADKREAVAKEIQADVKKYADEVVPLVRDQAVKLAPTTIGALLDEKFTEDELKQLIAIIESPVNRKFRQLGGEMQKALMEKLIAETQSAVQPKVKALEQAVGNRLGMQAAPAAPSKAAKPAAKPAAKAASK